MATVMDRAPVWSLWSSNGQGWSLLDTSPDRAALERQARSLKAVFTTKSFFISPGTAQPRN